MESCKQNMSCSEEESMASKEVEDSSSCSLLPNILQEEECSMCGDVGLPQYLFKCLTCSHRYQHIYCSKFYPYRIEATICNWCLPMEQLVNTVPVEVDYNTDMKVSNISIRNTKPDIDSNSNCPIHPQVHTLEKHTKAFECLLRVAELHDQGHQWDNPACPIDDDDHIIIGNLSEKNFVGHYQNNGKFNKLGHIAKELNNQEQASLMMQQLVINGCSDDQDRSFYARRGEDKIDCIVSRPSTSLVHLRHNRSHACLGLHQMGNMNQDVSHPQTIRKIHNLDRGHDQIVKKVNINQDLGHNQTIKRLKGEVDQARDLLQKPAIQRVNNPGIGCIDSNYDQSLKCQDATAVKRVRMQKQLQTAVGSNHHNINAAEQQRMHSQAVYNVCSDNSDDQCAGKYPQGGGDHNTGPPSKRLRLRQSGAYISAGENDVFNCAARQRGDIVGNIEADDQRRAVLSIKQSSPATPTTPHAWSSRAAGKRDHLLNSPSRVIKCRYKLLADVLC